ncbi:GNAT family N-acetyltransferase [Streptomyces sp. SID3343]|uniref:GNAT family N-acetyltransferase n=1 Tax=Streptomyces sp. SID3343 TaxID=2690260 RepID=UPI00136A5640|nr:GNAT family N-acetyltransferase [Streptomyces sp. SID3343]
MEPVEIAAGRFQLRPWNKHDVDVVGKALADPEIGRWAPPSADEDAPSWLARREQRWATGWGPSFAVTDAVTGEVFGHIALKHVDPQLRSAEIGYWTLPDARGLGVARHGLGAVTRWAFGALDLHRVELRHSVVNEASCAVARAGGYALEGVMRGYLPGPETGFLDAHLHARIASDA